MNKSVPQNQPYNTLKDQIQAILPQIRDEIAERSIRAEQQLLSEKTMQAIDEKDIHEIVPLIVDFAKRFIFQPGTPLEKDLHYFTWSMANHCHRQITTLENQQNMNNHHDPEHRIPRSIEALKAYFAAYQLAHRAVTGKAWTPKQQWLRATIDTEQTDGVTPLQTIHTLKPDHTVLALTSNNVSEQHVIGAMDKLLKTCPDFILIRTSQYPADQYLSQWFARHIANPQAKELIIDYDFKQSHTLTDTFDKLLATRPDQVILMARDMLIDDFLDHARNKNITLKITDTSANPAKADKELEI